MTQSVICLEEETHPVAKPTISIGRGNRFEAPRLLRNHQFDLLRILFATLVILAHVPELTDGNNSRDLFKRLSHTGVTFGTFAVDGFFLLSGFLIVKSWHSDANLIRFLKKRFIRIAPGYAVAVIVSTITVGLLAPGVDKFFSHIRGNDLSGILFLFYPTSLPVFPGNAYPSLNGSLWTILYEFRCYVLVAVFGVLGLSNLRWTWLAATFLLVAASALHQTSWPLQTVLGDLYSLPHLGTIFFIGGCFFLYRDKIKFTPVGAALAFATIVLVSHVRPQLMERALVLCGGYLLFYFTDKPLGSLHWMRRVPDISYGVYLYGFPVENFLVFRFHPSPWVTFAVATPVCFVLGWASYKLVEYPALRLVSLKAEGLSTGRVGRPTVVYE